MAFNLQGIVRKASNNITTEFDRLAYITQNIANIETNGYKTVRFESVMDADGSTHGVERVDTKTGEFLQTNNPLDVAIMGAGYIPVTTLQGEIRYTRDGGFTVNKDGMLTTKTGELVGSGIFIDSTAERIEIRNNGDVYTYKRLQDEPEYMGTIPIVSFQNPEGLKDVGSNNYIATEQSGKMTLIDEPDYIKQNGVERSNMDIISEVYTVSRINASILASSSLMKAVDTMYQEAINITD